MSYHNTFMARCLYLARLGGSFTAPNPMVGAVVVCDGKIIGEGYHRRYGEAHAEPNAIHSVKDKSLLKKSTLYVNLEPCSHYGKTPPCADLIVRMGIPRVVIATLDPNPKVSGRGVQILEKAGVKVEIGILADEARRLNRRFFCFQEKKRPFVTLKWAQTADGFIDRNRKEATEPALQISNAVTQQFTHKMRSENMAIMVGATTALLDNPSLTLRYWHGHSPLRVAIDRKGLIPENYRLKNGEQPTVIFTETPRENRPNVEYVLLKPEEDNLKEILHRFYLKNIHSVLVEGGAKLLQSFIDADLWDEANVEISTDEIGAGVKVPTLKNAEIEFEKNIENHRWIHYRLG